MSENSKRPQTTSLRNNVFSLLFVFAGILVLFFGLSISIAAYLVEDEVIFQRLLMEAKYLKTEYVKDERAIPRGKHFKIYYDLSKLPNELKTKIAKENEDVDAFSINNVDYRYFHFYVAVDQEAYLIVNASEISLIESFSTDLIVLFCVFILITLILSIGITLLISNRTIGPLIDLTQAIKSGKDNVPEVPKSLWTRTDEIGYLAKSLKRSYNKLSFAIERESEFTRDVSHELRTPIAVMMNSLTLSEQDSLTSDHKRTLKQQILLMNNRVEILLALARAESIARKEMSLRLLVEESILSIHKSIEEHNFNIIVEIPLSLKVNVNEHLIKLMFANLIENAIKYSCDKSMLIASHKTGMFFSNQTNSGISTALLQKSNKAPTSDGLGQGLYLATRIMESTGWKFNLLSHASEFKLVIDFNVK